MYNPYKSNIDDSARFILGKEGDRKLFVVGLNPSTANKEKSDTTVTKVENVAISNGFDGFVMTNLYPLRSTDPNRLPIKEKKQLILDNISLIQEIARTEKSPVFWAAWGGDIEIRPYLVKSLSELASTLHDINAKWVHYGTLTKYGHPRHPSRLSYSWKFYDFDVFGYIQKIA